MVLHPQDIRPGDYLSVGHHYWSKVTSCGYSEGARQAYVKCADVTYTFVIDGFERVTVRRDQGRAGRPFGDVEPPEGVNLTAEEATALARRVIVEHLDDCDWFEWEDYPELGEYAFERLLSAVDAEVRAMTDASLAHDRATGIDSQWLKGRAQ